MEIVVGRVGRAHGIRGEVSIDLTTDEPERRFAPGSSVVLRPRSGGADQSMSIRSTRPHQGRLLVTFDAVPDRTAAEALRGAQVIADVDETERPDDPEEFYDHQLEGLRVVTTESRLVGHVAEVLHTPAGELLSVTSETGAEVLVPFVSAFVTSVSLVDQTIEIDPPEGLLELN